MKKLFSIAIALAFMLSMLVVAPAGAVSQGTVTVGILDCTDIAGEDGTYWIAFHNDGLLLGDDGDQIDVLFPTGTVLADEEDLPETIMTGASLRIALGLAPGGTALNVTANRVSDKTVRFTLEEGAMIDKCDWVGIWITATNPPACDYHLQVGTSVAGPFTSNDYTIYTLKIELDPGKNLISLPAYPRDTSIEVVLAELFDRLDPPETPTPFSFSVWYWDAWDQEWVVFASDTSFDDLATMEAGKAYWIKVNKGATLKFKGDPYPECQGPPQKWCYPASWSMIGVTGTEDIWASAFLKNATLPWPNQASYAVSTIFYFESTGTLVPEGSFVDTGWFPGLITDATWMENEPGLAPYYDVELEPGVGYFMSFLGEACIIPPLP